MTKLVTFLSYAGDTSPRFFLEHEAWAAGETRQVEDEAAARLEEQFPAGTFKIAASKTAKPADPAKE